jgi:hypothetical protein
MRWQKGAIILLNHNAKMELALQSMETFLSLTSKIILSKWDWKIWCNVLNYSASEFSFVPPSRICSLPFCPVPMEACPTDWLSQLVSGWIWLETKGQEMGGIGEFLPCFLSALAYISVRGCIPSSHHYIGWYFSRLWEPISPKWLWFPTLLNPGCLNTFCWFSWL